MFDLGRISSDKNTKFERDLAFLLKLDTFKKASKSEFDKIAKQNY